jgi:hypothetical protein
MIFESNNFYTRWDGTCEKEVIPNDLIFIYQISIYDLKGVKHNFIRKVVKIGTTLKP